jgi:hypothetical protein
LDLQLLNLDGKVLGDLLDLALDIVVEPTSFAPENQSSIPERKNSGRSTLQMKGW